MARASSARDGSRLTAADHVHQLRVTFFATQQVCVRNLPVFRRPAIQASQFLSGVVAHSSRPQGQPALFRLLSVPLPAARPSSLDSGLGDARAFLALFMRDSALSAIASRFTRMPWIKSVLPLLTIRLSIWN